MTNEQGMKDSLARENLEATNMIDLLEQKQGCLEGKLK